MQSITASLGNYQSSADWLARANQVRLEWIEIQQDIIAAANDASRPSDAQVVAAVNQSVADNAIVVAAAGSLPAELHKHWNSGSVGGYHLEYGYSCMGYDCRWRGCKKLAEPEREVVVMVGWFLSDADGYGGR